MRGKHTLIHLLRLPCPYTDLHIAENIRQFKVSVDAEKLRVAQRPSDYAKKIEIVIPCFNHAPYLKETFRSIQNQSIHPNIQVTFINDKSEDNSLAVMKKIAATVSEKWIKVKVIDNEVNLNQAGSINRAVQESDNQLFVMLNADDILTTNCLSLILETYQKHPEIYLLGGSSLWFEDGSKLPNLEDKTADALDLTVYGPDDALKFDSLNSINMSQSSCSFLRPAWEAVGGYFERSRRVCSFDDRDFQMRVCSLFPIGIYKNYPMQFYRTTSSTGRATI